MERNPRDTFHVWEVMAVDTSDKLISRRQTQQKASDKRYRGGDWVVGGGNGSTYKGDDAAGPLLWSPSFFSLLFPFSPSLPFPPSLPVPHLRSGFPPHQVLIPPGSRVRGLDARGIDGSERKDFCVALICLVWMF